MSIQGKKCLITGGGGMLGSHIAEEIVNAGGKVTVFERRSHNDLKLQNLQKVKDKVSMYYGDIRSTRDCHQALANQDVVIHAAASGPVPYSIDYPVEIWENNVNGTLNLLEASRACGIERFVYINSSEAYGTAKYLPIDEKHGFYPRSPYGASKGAGELLVYSYYHSYGLNYSTIRLFNMFGPRPVPYGVIPKFIWLALDNEPIPIAGDGTQKRDYIFVKDAAIAVRLMTERSDLAGEAINVGSGVTVKIIYIAKKIIELTRSESKIVFEAPRPGEVPVLEADISKARAILGWKPEIDFASGLLETIDWCKHNKQFYSTGRVSKSL